MGCKSNKFFLKAAIIREIFLLLEALNVFASHNYVPLSLELQGCPSGYPSLFLPVAFFLLHHLEAVVKVLPDDIQRGDDAAQGNQVTLRHPNG